MIIWPKFTAQREIPPHQVSVWKGGVLCVCVSCIGWKKHPLSFSDIRPYVCTAIPFLDPFWTQTDDVVVKYSEYVCDRIAPHPVLRTGYAEDPGYCPHPRSRQEWGQIVLYTCIY